MTETLFKDNRIMWESVFKGDGVWYQITKQHSVVLDKDDVEWVSKYDWWRERKPDDDACYFRTMKRLEDPSEMPSRPELHRMIAGVANEPKIRVSFRYGCPFDLRKQNLIVAR